MFFISNKQPMHAKAQNNLSNYLLVQWKSTRKTKRSFVHSTIHLSNEQLHFKTYFSMGTFSLANLNHYFDAICHSQGAVSV